MFLEISQISQENTCARASFLIELQAPGSVCAFLKIKKNALSALFVCIYGLNSHFKYSFKNILQQNTKIFPCGDLLLYVVYEMFIEVPLF